MSNPWFRMYAEFATDPKVQMMAEAMQRRLVMLLCLRCSNTLVTLHDDEVAFQLRIDADELAKTKTLFVSKKFIDERWNLLNWDKRQFKSDTSNARVAKHRALQKEKQKGSSNDDVTLPKQKTNAPDTDTDTDTEVRAGKPTRKRGQKKCPKNFIVEPEAMEAMAEECPDVDIKAQTKIFRDHEFKDAKTDWPATWRNWMRTKQSRINEAKKPNQTQQPVESFRERDERLKREQVAKWAPKLSAGASSTQIDNFNTFDVEARDVTAIAGH